MCKASGRRLYDCSLGGLNYGAKCLRVRNRDFAEYLAIKLDIRFLAAVDELTVTQPLLSAGCAQTDNPQTPKVAFAALAINSRIDLRPCGGFLGQTTCPAWQTISSSDFFKDTLFAASNGSALYRSWHISFLL